MKAQEHLRCDTHLLQDQIEIALKYTTINWTTNWRLTEQKFYNKRFIEEATLKLVSRVEMQKGLAPLLWMKAEILEGYFRCKEVRGLNLKPGSPTQSTKARKRCQPNIWL